LRAAITTKLRLLPVFDGQAPELGKLSVRAESHDLALERLPFVCGKVRGTLNATLQVDDPLGDAPRLEARIRARGVSLGSEERVSLDVRAKANAQGVSVSSAIAAHAGQSDLRFVLPWSLRRGQLRVSPVAPLDATLRLRHLPIAPFLPPRGAISYATGSVSGEASLGGRLIIPRANGKLVLERIGFTATDLAQPLRRITGQLEFSEKDLILKRITAHDKDGHLTVDGRIDFGNLQQVLGDVKISARDFPLRQQGQVVATTDVDATIKTRVEPNKTRLMVRLTNVDTWLEGGDVRRGIDAAAHPDIVVDGVAPAPKVLESASPAAGPRGQPKASSSGQRLTELSLDASEHFWVKRDDFAVQLAARLEARIQGDDARITGKVDIQRGYLQLLGKVFEIERGSKLEFIGSPRPDPVVGLTAAHDNRRSGQRIVVKISGRGSAPVLTFFVDDNEVTAGDAFVAIYGSQNSNRRAGDANQEAKRFVGGLTAGLLATSARRELGAAAPILMVEPGDNAGQGRVRAGFEFDSLVPTWLRGVITGVYFEGIVANEKQGKEQRDSNVKGGALLELYFPRNLFTSGQYGPGATWSLDFGWQL
jgi:translocation and assembly module TamB